MKKKEFPNSAKTLKALNKYKFTAGNKGSKDRIITQENIPPGKITCNAKRSSSDSYCQLPGVAPFHRCTIHGGQPDSQAIELFKRALPLEQAAIMDTLVKDTLSMDGELASGKNLLLKELENYNRANYILNAYLEYRPNPPVNDSGEEDGMQMEMYVRDLDLHSKMVETAERMKDNSFKRAIALIRILSTAIAKNNKVKEGNKFTLDVRQVSKLLKVQLEAHYVCKGCAKLKEVVSYIRDHTKDIPINPNMGKRDKEAIGRRAYGVMVDQAKEMVDKFAESPLKQAEAEILNTEEDDDKDIIVD